MKLEIETLSQNDSILLVKHLIKDKPINKDVDIDDISKIMYHKSSAQIENIINTAGMFAASEDKEEIDRLDILYANMLTDFEINRGSFGHSDDKTMARLIAAYHEAGHIIANELLYPASVGFATVYQKYDEWLGFVKANRYADNEVGDEDITSMENEIVVALAGGIAVEHKFGITRAGDSYDIDKAFGKAVKLVSDNFADGFVFSDRINTAASSEREYTACLVEVEKGRNKAMRIIAQNTDLLDKLANLLLDKEIITSSEIQEVMKG